MAIASSDARVLPGAMPARGVRSESPVAAAWRRLARNRLALLGSLVAVAYILLGIVGPVFAP
ncbi:MAG: hypothetical protein ACRDJC_24110, partial [Thermomicrobiales bacterium]